MANKYNPQLKFEMYKLEEDGSETPMDLLVPLIPDDVQHHRGNKPILVECNINKALGSTQQTASVTLHNAPIIEWIRAFHTTFLRAVREQNWRIYIWAWYADSDAKTDTEYEPLFVGDIYDGVSLESRGINDSSITLNANGHDFIMRSGDRRIEYPAEASYLEVVNDIYAYFETELKAVKRLVIQDEEKLLENKINIRPFVINRSPTETLNDFCRELDFYWGVDAQTMYMIRRQEYLPGEQLPLIYRLPFARSSERTGQASLTNLGKYTFSLTTNWDNEFSLGKSIRSSIFPQSGFNEPTFGRINQMNIRLNNYIGHQVSMTCQYAQEGTGLVGLPPQRDDAGGRL